jgi:alpha-N-arabinofuranosidase
MLSEAAANFDYLSEHLYPKGNSAFDLSQGKFVPVNESPADHARRLPNRVKLAVEAWQEYQRRFPQLDMTKIKIALDEWVPGSTGGPRDPMYVALSSAEALNELTRNSRWFVLSDFTHLTGLVTGRTETRILPVGRMFQLYRHHFGTVPVAVTGNMPQPELKGTVGVDKPKVSSGSATYPLDVAAAQTADRRTVTVAIVNPTESDQPINVSFKDLALKPGGRLFRIVAPAAAVKAPGRTTGGPVGSQGAVIVETALTRLPATLTIPKQSISMYELKVR